MVTRSSKQLSTTLQELRRSAPGRHSQRPPMEERTCNCFNLVWLQQGSPMPPVMNPRPAPPVVRLDLLLEGLTTGAALLPSLRAHYHMGPLTGTGCTGAQARFTVHLPQHSLSFNTKVPPACEANLPSRASVELPPVQVAAEYLQDPGGPSQRDADGVVLRRGSYLSALAEIGTFEHSLTTDLLNHLVLVQKVFMKAHPARSPFCSGDGGAPAGIPVETAPLIELDVSSSLLDLAANAPTAPFGAGAQTLLHNAAEMIQALSGAVKTLSAVPKCAHPAVRDAFRPSASRRETLVIKRRADPGRELRLLRLGKDTAAEYAVFAANNEGTLQGIAPRPGLL
ncbi:hypothetical protein HPB49_026060 [Dermacentor silvarum]|nr:hypothetical protein HPB49_026060 [Dermacentor silvarum]